MDAKALKSRAIYVTKHGSHAYGLNTAASDLDIKGVMVAPAAHYHGFLNRVEQVEEHQPNDLVVYEIQKFFKLAADCNPNIIEVLHTDEADIVYSNAFGHKLRGFANSFLSQKAKHTFSGYAMAQLKRMRNHHEWMKNPPTAPKSRVDSGLPPNKNWCDAIDKAIAEGGAMVLNDEQNEQFNKERAWRKASEQWVHYQEWQKGRNDKRHELEVKFGYDTKHGMHLVRLMRMGHEIFTTGKVVVRRPDREELLAIRNEGAWSYDKIVEYAEQMDKSLTALYDEKKSPLPREPDRKRLDALCVQLIEEVLTLDKQTIWAHDWTGSVG